MKFLLILSEISESSVGNFVQNFPVFHSFDFD